MKTERPTMPTHYAIFDYWKDKAIDEKGIVYDESDCDFSKTEPAISDWGEPTCFACNIRLTQLDISDFQGVKEQNLFGALWNSPSVTKKCERAHIVPHSLGGSSDVNNVVLLCKRCHHDAPDVSDKRMMISWMYKRRKQGNVFVRCRRKAMEILENNFGVPGVFAISTELGKEVTTHGATFSEDSITYGYVQNGLKRFEKYIKNSEQELLEINRKE